MGALGLRWEPLRGREATTTGADEAGTASRQSRLQTASWLAGALGEPRLAKFRAAQLRTMGVCGGAGTRGVEPHEVAQFVAEAAGDTVDADAVQAALVAAMAADDGEEGTDAEGAGGQMAAQGAHASWHCGARS
eukprot:5765726-Pleurochrysis_carterae.AAC.1